MRRLPRLHWLEAMGSASLPVFCAHLVAVLLVLAFYGDSQTARPWWGDALLLAAVFAGSTRWRAPRSGGTAREQPPALPLARAAGRLRLDRRRRCRCGAITDCQSR